MDVTMQQLKKETKNHLVKDIIPFWQNLKDFENGGFYGYMGYDLAVDKHAVKGCILNSRILWFFSNAYLTLGDEALLEDAKHAFTFLKKCMDPLHGGIFWSVTYDGKPEDASKHTYNQAFAVYALASFYDASGDMEALEIAEELYRLIETKCRDEYGYLEAFHRDFTIADNDKLSENGVIAEKTMNTLLHVFEAYTELYRVTEKAEVADRLCYQLQLFADKVYNPAKRRQELFFDKTWNKLADVHSFGHDIETAWLIDRGLEILQDAEYEAKLSPITEALAEEIYSRAYKDHSLLNESENGVDDTTRVWWVQAEAVLGFLNAYEKDRSCVKYLDAAQDIWNYIKDFVIDKRKGSEWFWAVNQNHEPLDLPIVEPWKCPYHNGRMCMEIIRRTL